MGRCRHSRRAGAIAHWLREWLGEVLAVRTDLVSRRTHRSGPAVRSRPYDGFALAAAGHAKLCQLEQLGGAGAGPVWISVPRCLTGSLQGRRDGSVLGDCVGGEDEIEGGSRSEEDETGLPHAGTELIARPVGRKTRSRPLGGRPSEHT